MIGTLTSTTSTVLYLSFVFILFRVPWSISDSWYKLENWKKGAGLLFTLWTWIGGLSLAWDWYEISEGKWYQFLVFFACGSLMMLGTAAAFKKEMTREVHYVSAVVCVVSAVLWIILAGYWYIPAVSFAICIGIALRYKKWVFWIEIAALTATYITLSIV